MCQNSCGPFDVPFNRPRKGCALENPTPSLASIHRDAKQMRCKEIKSGGLEPSVGVHMLKPMDALRDVVLAPGCTKHPANMARYSDTSNLWARHGPLLRETGIGKCRQACRLS